MHGAILCVKLFRNWARSPLGFEGKTRTFSLDVGFIPQVSHYICGYSELQRLQHFLILRIGDGDNQLFLSIIDHVSSHSFGELSLLISYLCFLSQVLSIPISVVSHCGFLE